MLAFFIAGCAVHFASPPQDLKVLATTHDLSSVVQAIGGDAVVVTTLIPAAADPHQVLPKASMLLRLRRADAVVSMGFGYEHAFLPALLQKVRLKELQFDGSRHFHGQKVAINPLEVPSRLDRSLGIELHPFGNPHWNTDPARMRLYVAGLRDFLIRIAPESKAEIRNNWARWDAEMGRLLIHWEAWLKPARGKPLASYHRSWIYFAQRFGLQLAGEIEPKPGLAPSARQLGELTKTLRHNEVQLLLMEPWYHEGRLGDLVAASGITLVKKMSMSRGEGYLVWMQNLVEAVAEVYGVSEPLLADEASDTESVGAES